MTIVVGNGGGGVAAVVAVVVAACFCLDVCVFFLATATKTAITAEKTTTTKQPGFS